MVSLAAQQWMEQGEARGEARGIKAARIDDLLEIIEARFGSVDVSLREKIAEMSADDLRSLVRRAATAPNMDAVFDGAAPH